MDEGHAGYHCEVSFIEGLGQAEGDGCGFVCGGVGEVVSDIDGYGFSSVDAVVSSPGGRGLAGGNSQEQTNTDEKSGVNHSY